MPQYGTTAQKQTTKNLGINKSLSKAVSVLKCFTPQELEFGVADVARKMAIPKTTAHRILRTFAEFGLLEQNKIMSKYTIGPLLYMLGNLYLSTADVLKNAIPVLKEIMDLTGLDTNFGFFDKGYITIVMRVLGRSFHRSDIRIGGIVTAHTSSMGKAFLSELSEGELNKLYPEEKLLQSTRKSIATKKELKAQLEQIRRSGVAYTKEEGFEGIEGIGSLIRDATGNAIAAMSVHLPVSMANNTIRKQLGMLIKKGCSLVSYRLGYQMDREPVRDIEEILAWWKQVQVGKVR